ncbi:MAG TPA: DDE-type integrase/transposase/recombinase [Propionibacteriaceae bacterium]|jgi:hypothetical protein
MREGCRHAPTCRARVEAPGPARCPPHLQPRVDHVEGDTDQVVTDAAPVYPRVLEELVPAAWHHVEQYANNRIEADHSRLKQRLRPMRGPRTDRTTQVIIAGMAFMQNLRRGHYELATELGPCGRQAGRAPAKRSSGRWRGLLPTSPENGRRDHGDDDHRHAAQRHDDHVPRPQRVHGRGL